MKTRACLSLCVLFLFGCASQPVKFAGRTPEVSGTPAEAVWSEQLTRGVQQRWHENPAVLRAVRGNTVVERENQWRNARVGLHLHAGTRVKTEKNSVADLYLGENGPVLRLTEKSAVTLVRLDLWKRGDEKIVDTMIDVEEGKVFGNVKKLTAESSYLLRTRAGVIRIRGTEFEVAADGSCSIIKGAAQVFAPGGTFVVMGGQKFEPGKGVVRWDSRKAAIEVASMARLARTVLN